METDLRSIQVALAEASGIVDEVASRYARLCSVDGKISAELIDQHQIELVALAHLATELEAATHLTQHAINSTRRRHSPATTRTQFSPGQCFKFV